jgi:acyl carrier protein
VPIGVAGELHLSGTGLARGYLGRPDLTAQKFIANPFSREPDSRLYKTGDWARYQPDGNVECLGRIDQQVKIRGFRIELGEIETTLRQHASVANALVTAWTDASGEKRLVAYMQTRDGSLPERPWREFVRAKLPAYMVPANFVILPEFPLTPNGKIDVRRLPAPDEVEAAAGQYVAPEDDCEMVLAQIWQEVLSVSRLSRDDDFFALGADSLSATRAFARINRRFGIDLPLRAIFENPTVRALAALVRRSQTTSSPRPAARRRSRVLKTTV